MRRFFKRRAAPQSAADAHADGNITLITDVRGDVTVVSGTLPAQAGAPDTESACAAYATRVRQRYGRLLSRFGGEVYGFVHRAFLEYLTATDLAHRFHQQRELTEEDLQDLFATKVHDPAWHEILLLLVGLLDERFVAGVLDRLLAPRTPAPPLRNGDRAFGTLAFVARCLAEVRRPGQLAAQSEALVRGVIRLFELSRVLGEDVWYRDGQVLDLGRNLAALGEAWPGRRIYLDWYEEWGAQPPERSGTIRERDAGYQAADIWLRLLAASPAPSSLFVEPLRREATGNADPVVRAAAVLLHEKVAPGPSPLLLHCAAEDPDPAVRRSLLGAVVARAENAAEVQGFLVARSRHEEHPDVREAVLHELRGLAGDSPEARQALLRAGVAEPLASLTARIDDATEARALLRDALGDEDPERRAEAVEVLATGATGVDEQEILALLKERIERDASAEVVARAFAALPHLAHDVTELGRLALHHARHDERAEVREAAVTHVADSRPPLPEARELLLDRWQHDPEARVRAEALVILADRGRTDPEIAALVVEQVRRGGDRSARSMALETLGGALRADPATRGLVRELAVQDADPGFRAAMLFHAMVNDSADETAAEFVGVRVVDDPDPAVRASALSLLGFSTPLSLARDRATHDEDPKVRLTALRVLCDRGRDDPLTLDLLRAAAQDVSPDVRDLAARLLAILDRPSGP
ncbi:HEAT repeat domain-containing protein [Streptomyces sp. NPDC006477]|uniref:HEAT repeat domain-containing protein n=1 Tax=Streptomyces sp. NPDC006477 TaxID=3364747 RepID=UPI0036784A7C